jgi:ClpP class serine protease
MIYLYTKEYYDRYSQARADVEARGLVLNVPKRQPLSLEIDKSSNEATMAITGGLSETGPDAIDLILGEGGTAYSDIRAGIGEIDAALQPGGTIHLRFNTPGGGLDGLDQTYQAIAAARQRHTVVAHNDGTMASAGYYLASASDKIVANSLMAGTGSIGVVASVVDVSEAMAAEGIKKHVITNSKSPGKRPDVTTDAGRDVLVEQLDAAYDVFVERVTQSRGDRINKKAIDALEGRVVLATAALESGLIDEIQADVMVAPADKTPQTAGQAEDIDMDLKQFLAENPAAAAELKAQLAEAAEAGKKEATARVTRVTALLEADYPKPIAALALSCLKGERSLDALEGAVVAFEAMQEAAKSDSAKAETDELGDTASEAPATAATPSQDGMIETDEDYKAAVEALKRG